MNRNYLTFRECFMIRKNISIKKILFSIIFIVVTQINFAQINTRVGQTYVISDIHSVHQFSVDDSENRFMVTNKSDSNDRETLEPDLHYFYEFLDGSYYIDVNSFVNRENERAVGSSVIFKATKIYDDEQDPPLFQTGSVLSKVSLPNSARISSDDDFLLKISHLENNIVLNEEYVIVINPDSEIIENTGNILLLYNEVGKGIFNEGNIPPRSGVIPSRPGVSNSSTQLISDIKGKYGYIDHYFFENTYRNIFVNLKTDSIYNGNNGIFEIKALFLNEKGDVKKEAILELHLILNAERAHDPNDILVYPTCFDLENKPDALNYVVNFENVGGATAKDVFIDVDISNAIDLNAIDYSTFRFNNPNPNSNTDFRYTLNGLTINFKLLGIDLKGIGEDNVNVDETKGNINYSLPLKSDIEYTSIESNATILFKDGWEGKPCGNNCYGCDTLCKYPNLAPITTKPPAIATYVNNCDCEGYCTPDCPQDCEEHCPIPFHEDCLAFNSKTLEISEDGRRCLLTDGDALSISFKTEETVYEAKKIIESYGLKQQCFIDSPINRKEEIIWENCSPITSMDHLVIIEYSSTIFYIFDQKIDETLFTAKTKDEAEKIISIVEEYEAKYVCFDQKTSPSIMYLKE